MLHFDRMLHQHLKIQMNRMNQTNLKYHCYLKSLMFLMFLMNQ